MKFALGIIFLIFSNFWILHSQTSLLNTSLKPFQIDSSIHKILDERIQLINGKTNGFGDIKLFVNDPFLDEQHLSAEGIDVQVNAYLTGDTIMIIGETMFGFTFTINLLEQNATVQFITDYEEKIFKLAQTDSLSTSLTISCSDFKLTLTRLPQFEKGKIVEGIIEFSTPEYLTVEEGIEDKNKMKVKVYFRSTIK
ncbi:MAG: hypothetical protein IPP15_00330 [Saprospiraceae bacterium]|uniref:Uncharacterized protein n=1 Tax=Candidatus Opimibacter skivensis TaxID=2982028 RepID=A0A9D7SPJ1_9BACT|nr:hypothetical protein [Candidatus Opimibacter skivensis]